MPIMDDRLVFSDSQAMSSLSSTSNVLQSTDVLDISGGVAKDHRGTTIHPGFGRGMALNVQVEGTALKGSGGTAVFQITVYNHTAATSIKSGTIVDRYIIGGVTASPGIVDGKFLVKSELSTGRITKRYLGIVYQSTTQGVVATGTITAWLAPNSVKNDAHDPVSGT